MGQLDNAITREIKDNFDRFTDVEKNVARFFLNNQEKMNFSSKNISSQLFVSEASLSRFAKKCGYKGFREFIYDYERCFENVFSKQSMNELTKRVLDTYQNLLDKSLKLVDESQMNKVAKMLSECKRAYVYGMGSSGVVAREFQLRFMRLGLLVEAIKDSHVMKMNAALTDSDTLIIAISLSGETKEILDSVQIAKEQGAKILMITANESQELNLLCDEVLRIASTRHLELGNMISPQFPILVMVDIFYTYFLNTNYYYKSEKHRETISALYRGKKKLTFERKDSI